MGEIVKRVDRAGRSVLRYVGKYRHDPDGDAPVEVSPKGVLEMMQALVEHDDSAWISVKERTPTEADGTVWVCLADVFPYNEKEPYIDAKHDRRITEAFYSQFSKRWYKDGAVFPDGVVTHWIEKPQPPKADA